MISRDGAKNVLAGLNSAEKYDPTQNILGFGNTPQKNYLGDPSDAKDLFLSNSDRKDKSGAQGLASPRMGGIDMPGGSMYQNQSVILEKARRPPRPGKKLPPPAPGPSGKKADTNIQVTIPQNQPPPETSPVKENLEERLAEAQNDSPIPDRNMEYEAKISPIDNEAESTPNTEATVKPKPVIIKLTSMDGEGESFLAGPGMDIHNTSNPNALNLNDISDINWSNNQEPNDLRYSRKEMTNQILTDLVSMQPNITETAEEYANSVSLDSGAEENKQENDASNTGNTKKGALDQNEKVPSPNRMENLQVEGCRNLSSEQEKYAPKSTGNLDDDDNEKLQAGYESPLKTHSDKNVACKSTPKAIIDCSDEESGDDGKLASKVVQKGLSDEKGEGVGISISDVIKKDTERRVSMEEDGQIEENVERKLSGGQQVLTTSFGESPLMKTKDKSQALNFDSPMKISPEGNMNFTEYAAPKIEVQLCESQILEEELIEETPVQPKTAKDLFAEKMKKGSQKKKDLGISGGQGAEIKPRVKRGPPRKNNAPVLGASLLDTSRVSSNRDLGSETLGKSIVGSETSDRKGPIRRMPTKPLSKTGDLKPKPESQTQSKVGTTANLEIPVPGFEHGGSRRDTGAKSSRTPTRSVDADKFEQFKALRSKENSRSPSLDKMDKKSNEEKKKSTAQKSSINNFVQKNSANASPKKR